MVDPDNLTPEEEKLLADAISNLQTFIEDNTTHYAFVEDPRNEDDYDTFEYGTEPLPGDQTWKKSDNGDLPDGSAVTVPTPKPE
jgi:hypothetical protein